MKLPSEIGAVFLFGMATSVLNASVSAQGPAIQRTTQATPEEVSGRITELKSFGSTTPDNEIVIYEEMRRISDELARYRQQLRTVEADSGSAKIDTARSHASKLLQTVGSINCDTANRQGVTRLRTQLVDLSSEVSESYPGFRTDPWQSLSSLTDTAGTPPEACRKLQGELKDNDQQQRLLQFLETVRTETVTRTQQNSRLAEQIRTLIQALQERQATLQKKLNERSTQQQLSGNLWLVIGVIGVLSLGAIIAVKLFPEALQVEWVASGQVIQFVTVMILLSVIMALGLAGILKENILGTLLGGIAGHVLSQGVGRAAAREATRANRELPDK